jgi:hypothetical protein
VENFNEFYEILKHLNSHAIYLKDNRIFKPDESLLNRLNDIENELMDLILKDKEKQ